MSKFWRKKWFWVGVLAFIGAGVVWFFLYKSENLGDSSQVGLRNDTDAPAVIISPEEETLIGRDFVAQVFEEDLGSGLQKDSCTYQVCSYNSAGEERCSGTMQRPCNGATQRITVGKDAVCSSEGRDACMIFAQAQDRAGNIGEDHSSFHIDFTSPVITESFIEQKENGYIVNGRAQDKSALARCSLYADARYVQDMEFAQDCREDCRVTAFFQPEKPESSDLFIRCTDIAQNTSDGDTLSLKINQSPVIELCRVIPAHGNTGMEFRFSASAADPDEDALLYSWDFGDGTIGTSKEETHRYSIRGTYTPKLTVRDPEGLSAECSTAWVVVE